MPLVTLVAVHDLVLERYEPGDGALQGAALPQSLQDGVLGHVECVAFAAHFKKKDFKLQQGR